MEFLWSFIGFALFITLFFVLKIVGPGIKAKSKGKRGEKIVSEALKNIGYVFNDYYTIDKWGNTHQIDHILVNKKGVFVIETKALSGSIFGKDDEKYWTQVLAGGNVTHGLYNPVRQNESHARQIRYFLGRNCQIEPMVIFVFADISRIQSYYVWRLNSAINHIHTLPCIYDEEDVEEIINDLTERRSDVNPKEHIRNVKNTKRSSY